MQGLSIVFHLISPVSISNIASSKSSFCGKMVGPTIENLYKGMAINVLI
jgi:hypothetical protein